MKIYRRHYDKPLYDDNTEKHNEYLGDFKIIQELSEGVYESEMIGMKDNKVYLITEREVTGDDQGSIYFVRELYGLVPGPRKPLEIGYHLSVVLILLMLIISIGIGLYFNAR